MTKERFLEKVKNSSLSKYYFFVVVASNEDEFSVACVSKVTRLTNYTFTYSEKEDLLYHFASCSTSFYSLKEIIMVLDNILKEGKNETKRDTNEVEK